LILAGVATEGAVLATALQALNLGLRVSVVVDACAGLSRRAEDSAIRELEAAGARTTSITALLASADIDFATPTGIAILACL
jgi:nicotinamidase-related amidase